MIWYPYEQMKTMREPYKILDAEGVYLYTKDQNYLLQKGETLMIPEGISHGVKGNGAFKLMQITVTG